MMDNPNVDLVRTLLVMILYCSSTGKGLSLSSSNNYFTITAQHSTIVHQHSKQSTYKIIGSTAWMYVTMAVRLAQQLRLGIHQLIKKISLCSCLGWHKIILSMPQEYDLYYSLI